LNTLKAIAFTHKTTELDEIGKFHVEDVEKKDRLSFLCANANIAELMYISTCNRVEFVFTSSEEIDKDYLKKFFTAFNPNWDETQIEFAQKNCSIFDGEEVVRHLFNVASSLDSLVIGEREIITQLRKAFEESKEMNLTGDIIRMAVERTINAAKAVYTHSDIATKPVSVVSLAYHKLKSLNINSDSKFLVVGAGKTNANMLRFLDKHGFNNFTIFNRTLEKAEWLAGNVNGIALPFDELNNYNKPFDVIVTCTGASNTIFTDEVYTKLLNQDKSKKIVIDLAIPNDFDRSLTNKHNVQLIGVEDLKLIAAQNLKEREKEIEKCNIILNEHFEDFKSAYHFRKVEIAMRAVPKTVKEIKHKALTEVFAKDLAKLDGESKEVLDKVMSYLEKKYISVPMKMARDILIDKQQ